MKQVPAQVTLSRIAHLVISLFMRKKTLYPKKLAKIFDKLALSGILDWEEEEQQEVRSLIT